MLFTEKALFCKMVTTEKEVICTVLQNGLQGQLRFAEIVK